MDLSRKLSVHHRVQVRVPMEKPVAGIFELPCAELVVVLAGGSVGEVGEHHREPARVSTQDRDSRCGADVLDPAAGKLLLGSDGALAEERMCVVGVPQNEADAPVETTEGVCHLGCVLEGEVAEVPDGVLSAHDAVPRVDDVFVVSVDKLERHVVPRWRPLRSGGATCRPGTRGSTRGSGRHGDCRSGRRGRCRAGCDCRRCSGAVRICYRRCEPVRRGGRGGSSYP